LIPRSAPSTGVELHGHRGARGLAPENTIPGFREAIRLGVEWLEIDVGLSRDYEVIIHHDHAINPDIARRNDKWIEKPIPLTALFLDEIKSLDVGRLKPDTLYARRYSRQHAIDGTRIPTLNEMLAMPEIAANPHIGLNIEIKTSPLHEAPTPEIISRKIIDIIDANNARPRCRLQSFDWRNLLILRALAPDIELSFLTLQRGELANIPSSVDEQSPWLGGIALKDFNGSVALAIKHCGGTIWAPHFEDVTSQDIQSAHAIGLKVVTWTVNAAEEIRRLLAIDIDGIITDYPDIARRVIDAWYEN
jgi:glycerophosphoryl diester phosphodiesterase